MAIIERPAPGIIVPALPAGGTSNHPDAHIRSAEAPSCINGLEVMAVHRGSQEIGSHVWRYGDVLFYRGWP